MKTSTGTRIVMAAMVAGGLSLTMGCAADPQTGQPTAAETARQTREAVKQDVKTVTQGTKDRIQTEKTSAT
ncbi:MAG: hypothetical protein KAX87_08490, partial [Nitrospira sp.]|nr:hypothetical protein [Nitrospira sp.]